MKSKKEVQGEPSDASTYRYWAFISYSSKDKSWGRWLHRAIESYGIPAQLVSHPTPAGHPAPKRFHPLFRDREELPASADLGAQIEEALRASRYLIVVCSRHAAQSKWVNKEIATFQKFARHGRILAIIVDGEPNAGGDHECFPPALRQSEPIAADARPEGDGKSNARLKLLAGMLGVSFDALKQRDNHRRIRRLQLAVVAALTLTVGFASLAWYANQQRIKATAARNQAEGMLEFLVYDLQEKLKPIGRLDILADVQKKVGEYFGELGVVKDDPRSVYNREISEANDGDRMMDEGDLNGAMSKYLKGLATAENMARADRSDLQRQRTVAIFQTKIGRVRQKQGNLAGALVAFRTSLAIAEQLTENKGSNAEDFHDLAVAHGNVGDVHAARGDSAAALQSYRQSLLIMRALLELPSVNPQLQRNVFATNLKLSALLLSLGQMPEALSVCRTAMDLGEQLAMKNPRSADTQHDMFVVTAQLGAILAAGGKFDEAVEVSRSAVTTIENLAASDPANSRWQRDLAATHGKLADIHLARKAFPAALEAYRAALAVSRRLVEIDPSDVINQHDVAVSYSQIGTVLEAQGDLTAAAESFGDALSIAEDLATRDPLNNNRRRDLVVTHYKLGQLAQTNSRTAEADVHLRRCYAILSTMRREGVNLDGSLTKLFDQLDARFASSGEKPSGK